MGLEKVYLCPLFLSTEICRAGSNTLHSLFHVTFLTTGRSDSKHLTSPTSFSHRGSGPHVSAGPTIILVVNRSGVGTGNRPESCGLIKGLSLASLNSLAPCWRKAYTGMMGLRGCGVGGSGWKKKQNVWCIWCLL